MKKIKNIITLLAMTMLAFSMTAMGEDSLQGDDSLQVGKYPPSKRSYNAPRLKIETYGEVRSEIEGVSILIQQNVQLKNKDTKEDIAESLTKASSVTTIDNATGMIKMPSVHGNIPITYYDGSGTTVYGRLMIPKSSPDERPHLLPIFWSGSEGGRNYVYYDDRALIINPSKDDPNVYDITLTGITSKLIDNPIDYPTSLLD